MLFFRCEIQAGDDLNADDKPTEIVEKESDNEVESEQVIDSDNEEVEAEEEKSEKKASDNAQKSFFDTFDENQ